MLKKPISNNSIKSTIQELISKGRTRQAIQLLKDNIESSHSKYTEILILSARLEDNLSAEMMNIVDEKNL